MSRIDDKTIEDILMANDVVDVVSNYVSLQKKGRNYFGLCPFHNEKTPSFSVSPEKQIFHCFGCKKGGNAIHFIQLIENISFVESLKMLGDRVGIKLPERSGYKDPHAQLRERMKAVLEDSAKYFQAELFKPSAKIAQDYINRRKINLETLKEFRIGFSKMGLYKHLKDKGYEDKEILETGLVYKRDDGMYIDRFRDRLMFPISDITGNIIAFGGRILDDKVKMAKYINSNENLVYSKGNHLYALNLAKRHGQNQLIITEGYMDTISLYQRGVKNVVAALGTALTERQAKLLARTTKQVIIAFDSDASGQDAALRGLEILEKTGVDLRVLELNDAEDPDEYIVKFGKDMFEKQVAKSISLVEFKIKRIKQRFDLNIPKEKIMFLTEVSKILARVESTIERETYIKRISQIYDISEAAIYSDVNKLTEKTKDSGTEIKIETREVKKKSIDKETRVNIEREEILIYILLEYIYDEKIKKKIKDSINLDDLSIEENKRIFEYIFENNFTNKDLAISNIEDEELRSQITSIYAKDIYLNRDEILMQIKDILKQFQIRRLNLKEDKILEELKNTNITEDRKKELENELIEIIKKKSK